MIFQDRYIRCTDCGTTFTFTAIEQEYFLSRNYTEDPKCCLACRKKKKAEYASGGNHELKGRMLHR